MVNHNINLATKSSKFKLTDNDLYLSHIDNLFIWRYQGMLENLRQMKLHQLMHQFCRIFKKPFEL